MAGALLLVAGLAGAAMLLRQPAQVSIVADWMTMFMVLCPVALCLFPLAVGLITSALYMNQVHRKSERLMGKAEAMSQSLSERAINVSENISKKSISLNARMAFFDPLWRVFDRKEDTNGKHNP